MIDKSFGHNISRHSCPCFAPTKEIPASDRAGTFNMTQLRNSIDKAATPAAPGTPGYAASTGPFDPHARRTRVRHLIVFMLFFVTTLNYADRAAISITGTSMQHSLGLSPVAMGYIFSAFAWSYV